MSFFAAPRKWYRGQLLKNSCWDAKDTLRLLGIMIATQCVDFSLINTHQGGYFRGCFFRLFAAPPVFAHEIFFAPFSSAPVWSAPMDVFWAQMVVCHR